MHIWHAAHRVQRAAVRAAIRDDFAPAHCGRVLLRRASAAFFAAAASAAAIATRTTIATSITSATEHATGTPSPTIEPAGLHRAHGVVPGRRGMPRVARVPRPVRPQRTVQRHWPRPFKVRASPSALTTGRGSGRAVSSDAEAGLESLVCERTEGHLRLRRRTITVMDFHLGSTPPPPPRPPQGNDMPSITNCDGGDYLAIGGVRCARPRCCTPLRLTRNLPLSHR